MFIFWKACALICFFYHEPEDRHSMSSMPFRLNPKSHLKVARPPILRVVRIMVPFVGVVMFLHRVSLQVGASGSHFPLVSHRRLSNPENGKNKKSFKSCSLITSHNIYFILTLSPPLIFFCPKPI